MLVGRKLRSRLDLLKPDLQQKVQEKQLRQRVKRDKRSRSQHFKERKSVFAKNFGPGERWILGKIIGRKGPASFEVELSNGQKWRRHQDQLQKIVVSEPDGASSDNMYTVLGAENGSSNLACT